jgi:hypothetical protein
MSDMSKYFIYGLLYLLCLVAFSRCDLAERHLKQKQDASVSEMIDRYDSEETTIDKRDVDDAIDNQAIDMLPMRDVRDVCMDAVERTDYCLGVAFQKKSKIYAEPIWQIAVKDIKYRTLSPRANSPLSADREVVPLVQKR